MDMSLHSIVFSPTATSAKVADAVARGLGQKAVACDLTHTSDLRLNLSERDVAIIAAPVYGGRMAPIAKERMKGIRAQGTPCVLIAVYGNRAFENALCDMTEFVRSLGFRPIAAGAFVGEHSYSTDSTPIATGRPDAADLAEAEAFGRAVTEKLGSAELPDFDAGTIHDLPSPEQSLRNFREFVAEYMTRREKSPSAVLLPELDAELCNNCGSCVELCPTEAIPVDDVSHVDASRCIKCCACVKGCPEGARSLESPFAPVLSKNFNDRKPPVWAV